MISITRPFPIALLIGLAAGIAIAVAATTIVSAQSATLSTEVRVTARLLENGKVEFGLQQREGGGWGEIILPRVNKFPYATATVDRWLYSSRVTLATAEAAASGWQRTATAQPVSVDWRLAGTGAYDAGGWARSTHRARPELELGCSWISADNIDDGWGSSVTVTAREPYVDVDRRVTTARARYRVGESTGRWVEAWGFERIVPRVFIRSTLTFMDALAAGYARSASPFLFIEAHADGARQFWASFDLTGLPAVLADLPCYE